MRRFSSSSNNGEKSSSDVLARSSSFQGINEDSIKSATQRFDVEIVLKLMLPGKGLVRMLGLERCTNLIELNLANNALSKIEGLESLALLRRLNLSANRLSRLEGLAPHLSRLEGLALQSNQLASLDSLALAEQLARLPALKALCLQNVDRSAANAVCRQAGYKAALLAALPGLTNLDGERSPHSLNYAELAAEADAFRANPPPPKDIVVPDVQPWLVVGAGAAEAEPPDNGVAQATAELQKKHDVAIKALDECEMLCHVLRDEVGKARSQLEGKAVAAVAGVGK